MTPPYEKNVETGIWMRLNGEPFPYSDGDAIENRILNSLRNAVDVSTGSPELFAAIDNWPSEYHLNVKRRNLLLPFNISPHHTVLELGCGCGAITRHLGETGAKVVAVEGSQRRARIAAERCRDLDNVSIYCDNIVDFSHQEKFDCVTLIGVLEYAPQYLKSPDPIKYCLETAMGHLKPGGVLILAIENQLGLKYFNGCSEDHLGIPYFGIQDRYGNESPVTFGHHELRSRILSAGYKRCHFYYPFPDYKLPNLILSQKALESPDFNIGDLMCMLDSRDYAGIRAKNFKENRVWPLLARNQLIKDLANSFLVIASKTETDCSALESCGFLAATYATERQPAFATETRFTSAGNGIKVSKKLLQPQKANIRRDDRFNHRLVETPYYDGRLLIAEFQELMALDCDVPALAKLLEPWISLLKSNIIDYSHNELPGNFLDCIPRNIIRGHDDVISVIDAEWIAKKNISIEWIVVRGIADCIFSSLIPTTFQNHSIGTLIILLAKACNFSITGTRLAEIAELEDSFQDWASVHNRIQKLSECLSYYPNIGGTAQLERELAVWKAEVTRIKSSLSWQITKPLRLLAPLTRLFTQQGK